MLYGGSFYTRDWRPVVHKAGQPVAEQVSARSAFVARPMAPDAKPAEPPSRLVELTARVEPEVTGAVARVPEPVASSPAAVKAPSGAEQASALSDASLPRTEAQAEAARRRPTPFVRKPSERPDDHKSNTLACGRNERPRGRLRGSKPPGRLP